MSLLSCLRCATRFAVGLVACPHCLSEDFEEADVPKITHGGVSFPQDPDVPEPVPPPPVSALKADHVEYAVAELGVPPEEAESMTKPELVELARTDPEARPAPSLSRAPDG